MKLFIIKPEHFVLFSVKSDLNKIPAPDTLSTPKAIATGQWTQVTTEWGPNMTSTGNC